MSIRPALPADLTEKSADCTPATCYHVELYNYALNTTRAAIVNLPDRKVAEVRYLAGTQPDIPEYLVALAIRMAIQAPEVQQALGMEPSADMATMAAMKTALNNTRCERSGHLCIAPTFLQGNRALWAIVDLTDMRIVGVRWTDLGQSSAPVILTERTLIDEEVYENYCEQYQTISQDNWEFQVGITPSDGLELRDVRYRGERVLHSVKLVDWHVNYSQQDNFGYNDSTGCPIFGPAVVAAWGPPVIEPLPDGNGFALRQDFRQDLWPQACNYRYEQRFDFYRDGRVGVVAINHGRGCGNDGVYRPIIRLHTTSTPQFQEWDGNGWQTREMEQWQLQAPATPYTREGYQYRLVDSSGKGFALTPGTGRYGNNRGGDNAYTYVTVHHPDRPEGHADLPSLGSCCSDDHRQGPEMFQDPPEPLAGQELILWYVPYMKNDDTPGAQYCWAEGIVVDGLVQMITYPCQASLLLTPLR
jgi:hypothetical protein